MKNEKHFGRRGQLLVEAIVASGVIVVGLVGVLGLLSSSLGLNRVIGDQYKAAYLASEGIEVIRSIVDENTRAGNPWNAGLVGASGCTSGCIVEYDTTVSNLANLQVVGAQPIRFNSGVYNHRIGLETPFERFIAIEMDPDDTAPAGCGMKVTSRVEWVTRGAAEFNIEVEDRFYNWRGFGC